MSINNSEDASREKYTSREQVNEIKNYKDYSREFSPHSKAELQCNTRLQDSNAQNISSC